MLGDFYPLTPYSLNEESWIAWQFDRPGNASGADGMVQAFRRTACGQAGQTFRLRGLDPAATYEVTDLDEGKPRKVSGKELMENGLAVEIKDKPGAAVISYRKAG
jgi:alpha-galactosidase